MLCQRVKLLQGSFQFSDIHWVLISSSVSNKKKRDISSAVLVASFENKHQVAETLLFWSTIIESAANEQGILYAIAMLQLVTDHLA